MLPPQTVLVRRRGGGLRFVSPDARGAALFGALAVVRLAEATFGPLLGDCYAHLRLKSGQEFVLGCGLLGPGRPGPVRALAAELAAATGVLRLGDENLE